MSDYKVCGLSLHKRHVKHLKDNSISLSAFVQKYIDADIKRINKGIVKK